MEHNYKDGLMFAPSPELLSSTHIHSLLSWTLCDVSIKGTVKERLVNS